MDGSLGHTFLTISARAASALRRSSESFGALVDGVVEAAGCWAPRICIRLKGRGAHMGKEFRQSSEQKLHSGEAGMGPGISGSHGQQCWAAG